MHGMLDGLGFYFSLTLWLIIIFVPLGLWKLIELIIWAFQHISIGII